MEGLLKPKIDDAFLVKIFVDNAFPVKKLVYFLSINDYLVKTLKNDGPLQIQDDNSLNSINTTYNVWAIPSKESKA